MLIEPPSDADIPPAPLEAVQLIFENVQPSMLTVPVDANCITPYLLAILSKVQFIKSMSIAFTPVNLNIPVPPVFEESKMVKLLNERTSPSADPINNSEEVIVDLIFTPS